MIAPRVVNLDDLIPAEFVVELAGERYTLPGDPPLDLILKLGKLFERSQNANGDAGGVGLEVLAELDAEILKLLQVHQPLLTASPFGVIGVQHVVASLLEAYNFVAAEEKASPASRSRRPADRRRKGGLGRGR